MRFPIDYRYFIYDFKYGNLDKKILSVLDKCIDKILSRRLHCSFNMHRIPGYCINGIDLERHNLWKGKIVQDAFTNIWKMFAERYKDYPNDLLSFDFLNEPSTPGQYGMTREKHEKIIRNTISEIRKVAPDRTVIIDGIYDGRIAIPELSNIDAVHSTRGYHQPMMLTHWHASRGRCKEVWQTRLSRIGAGRKNLGKGTA